jgi:prophage regulatory protein
MLLVAGKEHDMTRFLRLPEVLALVGVSWITILRWEKRGLFPRRRRLGPNTVAWREDEVAKWCADRAIGTTERAA